MEHISKIKKILETNDVITTKMVTDLGVPRVYLKLATEQGIIEKVAHGIYVNKDIWRDDMFVLQLRYSKGIYSFNTSLFLLDLTDVIPDKFDMTIPESYNTSSLRDQNLNLSYMAKKYYNLGITEAETICGNKVKCYNMEKTICDLVRRKKHQDIRILTDALKFYVKRKDRNLNNLAEYSKIMGIDKEIRQYMEVLL